MAVFGHIQLAVYCENDRVMSRKLLLRSGPFFERKTSQKRRSAPRAGAITTSRSTSQGRERNRRCFPDPVVIALTGDGAMQMNGLNASITVAKHWKERADPRWIQLVLNNREFNQVTVSIARETRETVRSGFCHRKRFGRRPQ
jgi:hypothetical protein